jgi:hypothetical protein
LIFSPHFSLQNCRSRLFKESSFRGFVTICIAREKTQSGHRLCNAHFD